MWVPDGARMIDDPICGICNEPRSAHVATDAGPYTHPREARGEGTYVLVRSGFTMAGCMGGHPGDPDIEFPDVYEFRPTPEPKFQWGWRPE